VRSNLTLDTWCNDDELPNGANENNNRQVNAIHLGVRVMKNFSKKMVTFLKREDGPTAVEYAVMLALIIVVCIASVRLIGTNANTTFNNVATQIGSTT
jgi:pilus assembly protein Flp/PilA